MTENTGKGNSGGSEIANVSRKGLSSSLVVGKQQESEVDKTIGKKEKKGLKVAMVFTKDAEEGRKGLEHSGGGDGDEKEDKKKKKKTKHEGETHAEHQKRKKEEKAAKKQLKKKKSLGQTTDGDRDRDRERGEDVVESAEDECWVWKVEQKALKSGHTDEHSLRLPHGHYHLLFVKDDTVMGLRRRLKCHMTVMGVRASQEVSHKTKMLCEKDRESTEDLRTPTRASISSMAFHEQFEMDIGGIGHSRKQHVDFRVVDDIEEGLISISVQSTAAGPSIVPVHYSLFISERDKPCIQAHKKKGPSVPSLPSLPGISSFLLPENPSSSPAETLLHESHRNEPPSSGKDICRLANVNVVGKERWVFELEPGFYYLGLKNTGGTGHIVARMTISGSCGTITRQVESLEMIKGSEPWRQYFEVEQNTNLSILNVRVSAKTKSGIKMSMKLKQLPNPYSLEEIRKRTVTARMYIGVGLALLLVLSYLFDVVMAILKFSVYGLSVRFSLLLLLIPFAVTNKEHLRMFFDKKKMELLELVNWVKQLEGTDTNAIQKLALLRERQIAKKKREKLKKIQEQEL